MSCCHCGEVRGKHSWLTAELILRQRQPNSASTASIERRLSRHERTEIPAALERGKDTGRIESL